MTEKKLIIGFVIFFTVGIVLHLVPVFRIIPEYITDLFLFSANAIVFWQIFRLNRNWIFLALFILAWMVTYFAEAAGVHTGAVFGQYQYGDTMKLQLMDVPLIIPFNWVVLVLGMTSILLRFKLPRLAVPGLAAVALVLFDYTMEPVAIHLDYWTWAGGAIPLQNYIAWFIIALLISSATVIFKINLNNKLLRIYVAIQWVFFLILNVFFQFIDA